MKMKVMDGGGAAWRARYLYCDDTLVCHIGIDPNGGTNPVLFGGIGGWWIKRKRWIPHLWWRIPLPRIPWRWVMETDYDPFCIFFYKLFSRFWHGMDGRYGWGGSCR